MCVPSLWSFTSPSPMAPVPEVLVPKGSNGNGPWSYCRAWRFKECRTGRSLCSWKGLEVTVPHE